MYSNKELSPKADILYDSIYLWFINIDIMEMEAYWLSGRKCCVSEERRSYKNKLWKILELTIIFSILSRSATAFCLRYSTMSLILVVNERNWLRHTQNLLALFILKFHVMPLSFQIKSIGKTLTEQVQDYSIVFIIWLII